MMPTHHGAARRGTMPTAIPQTDCPDGTFTGPSKNFEPAGPFSPLLPGGKLLGDFSHPVKCTVPSVPSKNTTAPPSSNFDDSLATAPFEKPAPKSLEHGTIQDGLKRHWGDTMGKYDAIMLKSKDKGSAASQVSRKLAAEKARSTGGQRTSHPAGLLPEVSENNVKGAASQKQALPRIARAPASAVKALAVTGGHTRGGVANVTIAALGAGLMAVHYASLSYPSGGTTDLPRPEATYFGHELSMGPVAVLLVMEVSLVVSMVAHMFATLL